MVRVLFAVSSPCSCEEPSGLYELRGMTIARPPAYSSKPPLPLLGWNGTAISSAGIIKAIRNRKTERSVAWNSPSHAAVASTNSSTAPMMRYGSERGVVSVVYDPPTAA